MSLSTTPLSGDTASGRSWPSIWRRVLYPNSPFGLVARLSSTHEGPDRLRSAPITDPLSRGFGIPNRSPDPLVQRAGRDHPFPVFTGSPGRERDVARRTCHVRREKNTGIEPLPAHLSPTAERLRRQCPLPSRGEDALLRAGAWMVVVVSCTAREREKFINR